MPRKYRHADWGRPYITDLATVSTPGLGSTSTAADVPNFFLIPPEGLIVALVFALSEPQRRYENVKKKETATLPVWICSLAAQTQLRFAWTLCVVVLPPETLFSYIPRHAEHSFIYATLRPYTSRFPAPWFRFCCVLRHWPVALLLRTALVAPPRKICRECTWSNIVLTKLPISRTSNKAAPLCSCAFESRRRRRRKLN